MMAEFRIEPQQTYNRKMLIIFALVLVVLLGGIALYVRYNPPTPRTPSVVNIPDVLRAGDTNFEYYKTRIRLEDVKASLGINYNNSRIAMSAGTGVNDGDRKLEALELHVTLYDMWGKFSKERTVFAVRPGVGFNPKPMEPLERRTFNISVEGMEYYWDPKEISLEITGLKYK
jgi:hypothetical protein